MLKISSISLSKKVYVTTLSWHSLKNTKNIIGAKTDFQATPLDMLF